MKILMTADTVGGVWSYALELAEALAPRDVSIVLATMGVPLTRAQWSEVRSLDNVEIAESTYRVEWMPDPWDDVQRAGEWLLELASCHAPNVVHLNGYAHASLSWPAPTCVVAHSCVLSWWRAVKGGSLPASWSRYASVVQRALCATDLVVAPSYAMLAALEREYGRVPGARVVYNARRAERFPAGTKEPLVLCAGRLWDEGKNVAAVDAVAPALDWPVYVAGEAERDGDRVACSASTHLGKLTTSQLARWMSRAAIYALPARYEPFGLSLLEAALAGCALVVGNIATLRELWGGAARFVPPDDPDELRDTLRALIADDALRARTAQSCRQRALEFTADRMADGYMSAYAHVLARATSETQGAACMS